jgi:ribonuclease HII
VRSAIRVRKVFQQAYRLLDEGATLADLAHPEQGLGRPMLAALEHMRQSLEFDRTAFDGSPLVVGMDEVGRGPLAGPLVAVCLVLPSPPPLPFLRDSKKLLPDEREALVPRIVAHASHLGYGVVQPSEFGRATNLHHLTFRAMRRALNAAGLPRECALLVDGKFPLPRWGGPQKAVVKGDDTSFRIAAASVLAKVYRDKIMYEACARYPQYGFSKNVGYGTEEHQNALRAHGPCPLHRRNFVARVLADATPRPEQQLLF